MAPAPSRAAAPPPARAAAPPPAPVAAPQSAVAPMAAPSQGPGMLANIATTAAGTSKKIAIKISDDSLLLR